ncbi:MAG: LysR substrate-binding domain-containing protein [Alphaproteobacteria bacterium]
MALPPLTWFRAFEAAARHLNFTAAAEELNLTQSAVSQHVRSLELRLGAQFFQRKARGLALTDAGRRLLPYVTGAMSELGSGVAMFQPLRDKATLTVACSTSIAQWVLAPWISDFIADNPGTRIRFVSTIWPDHHPTAEADVEIRFGAAELVGQGARPLAADRVVPVRVSGSTGTLSVADLADTPLIQTVGSSDTWKTWAASCGEGGLFEPTYWADSYGLALELVRQGAGVGLISALIASAGERLGVVSAAWELAAPARDSFFLARRETGRDGLSARFEDWLCGQVLGSGPID